MLLILPRASETSQLSRPDIPSFVLPFCYSLWEFWGVRIVATPPTFKIRPGFVRSVVVHLIHELQLSCRSPTGVCLGILYVE